jgi:hypothetical protein
MRKDKKIQNDRWTNPEFLEMKYIAKSGITNLNQIYLRKVINSVIYLESDRAMQMIIILYLLKCIDSKKLLILDTGRASNPQLNSEPKKKQHKKHLNTPQLHATILG